MASHEGEPHGASVAARLNWLRAGVLGANDGIVSIAALVVGVAAATAERGPILTAGAAGVAAGAISMALGEYVSVSTQRDSERALIAKERRELAADPESELRELAHTYQDKGLSEQTALTVARELTDNDALTAHAQAELGIDPSELTNPWHAAASSAVAFVVGSALPMIAILAAPADYRVPVTFAGVLAALALTGALSAWLGGAPRGRAVLRLTVGGAVAMVVTYLIGQVVGTAV